MKPLPETHDPVLVECFVDAHDGEAAFECLGSEQAILISASRPITGILHPSRLKLAPSAIASAKVMPSARLMMSIRRGGTPSWRTPSYDAKSSTPTSNAESGA